MRKGERGFSIIEVLIALAVLGIVAVSFLMAINTTTQAVFIADEKATAESIARSQLEYVRQQEYEAAEYDDVALYVPISGFQEGYSIWSVDRNDDADNPVEGVLAVPWDSETDEAVSEDVGLQRIKLVIKHYDSTVLIIEGYKVDEIVY